MTLRGCEPCATSRGPAAGSTELGPARELSAQRLFAGLLESAKHAVGPRTSAFEDPSEEKIRAAAVAGGLLKLRALSRVVEVRYDDVAGCRTVGMTQRERNSLENPYLILEAAISALVKTDSGGEGRDGDGATFKSTPWSRTCLRGGQGGEGKTRRVSACRAQGEEALEGRENAVASAGPIEGGEDAPIVICWMLL